MKKLNRGDNIRYPLPKNLGNSKELISAIKILNSSDNSHFVKNDLKEKVNSIITKNIEDKHSIKIWKDAFLQRIIPNSSLITFPEVAPEFLIRECKNILENKNYCFSFVNWLIENKIIEQKEIGYLYLDYHSLD